VRTGSSRGGKEGCRAADALRVWAHFRWVGEKRHAKIAATYDGTYDMVRQRQVDCRMVAHYVALPSGGVARGAQHLSVMQLSGEAFSRERQG